jgi:hypothetical protein
MCLVNEKGGSMTAKNICEKCGGKMIRKQRVNKKGTGLSDPYFECKCGWKVDEKIGTGKWPND